MRSNNTVLQTILRNLIGNAVKFSQRRGCVSVRCHSDGPSVTVEIIDNDQGISDADLCKIFDGFKDRLKVIGEAGLRECLYTVVVGLRGTAQCPGPTSSGSCPDRPSRSAGRSRRTGR